MPIDYEIKAFTIIILHIRILIPLILIHIYILCVLMQLEWLQVKGRKSKREHSFTPQCAPVLLSTAMASTTGEHQMMG